VREDRRGREGERRGEEIRGKWEVKEDKRG
jgi:hypothetical protein